MVLIGGFRVNSEAMESPALAPSSVNDPHRKGATMQFGPTSLSPRSPVPKRFPMACRRMRRTGTQSAVTQQNQAAMGKRAT
jgi:hypothetical protein